MFDLFDESEQEIKLIPGDVEGDRFLTEVADIERRVILETRLAATAIRQFPRDLSLKAEGIISEFSLIPDARKVSRSNGGFERGDRVYNRRRVDEEAAKPRAFALRERKSIVIGLLREVFRELTSRRVETPFGILVGDPRNMRQMKAKFYEGKNGRR